MKAQECPCGSGVAYAACCGLFLGGTGWPETAEQLMRSRYTAYVLEREDYLLQTWHPSRRPPALQLAAEPVRWLGLKVLRAEGGGAEDREGLVEFVARFKRAGKAERLHELSRFVKEADRWLYVAGVLEPR